MSPEGAPEKTGCSCAIRGRFLELLQSSPLFRIFTWGCAPGCNPEPRWGSSRPGRDMERANTGFAPTFEVRRRAGPRYGTGEYKIRHYSWGSSRPGRAGNPEAVEEDRRPGIAVPVARATPKGLNKTAQGNALGMNGHNRMNPEGVPQKA